MEKENYFVAYLDILGFENLVRGENVTKLEKCFDICDKLISNWKDTDSKNEFQVFNFSDTIVILVATNKENKKAKFKQLCIALAEFQYKLAEQDIWLRGGVSFGKMDVIQKTESPQSLLRLYGTPLIEAYRIESHIAKYPRIVIEPQIMTHLGHETPQQLISETNKEINFENWKGAVLYQWSNYSKIPHDAAFFIDYLHYIFVFKEHIGGKGVSKLDTFARSLNKNLHESSLYYDKYRWVVDDLISKKEDDEKRHFNLEDILSTNDLLYNI